MSVKFHHTFQDHTLIPNLICANGRHPIFWQDTRLSDVPPVVTSREPSCDVDKGPWRGRRAEGVGGVYGCVWEEVGMIEVHISPACFLPPPCFTPPQGGGTSASLTIQWSLQVVSWSASGGVRVGVGLFCWVCCGQFALHDDCLSGRSLTMVKC